mgnify:CR=1 FL=1
MTTRTKARTTRFVGLAVTTALASTLLSGCGGMPGVKSAQAQTSQGAASEATSSTVMHAEAAVLAAPRDAAARSALGEAYLEAGRFRSASATFAEAVELGDTAARTIINLVLAQIGAGDNDAAAATLNTHVDALDPADYGFAIALAGRAEHGAHILKNQLRMGNNTPKVRQNLAYAFALAGDWRSARLMAAEDVPADQLGDRMMQWAAMAHPTQGQLRVASLLEVRPGADPGQPVALALANFPANSAAGAQLAAAPAPVEVVTASSFTPAAELPAVDTPQFAAFDVGEAALADATPLGEAAPAAAPMQTASVAAADPAPSFAEAFAPARPARAPAPAAQRSRLAAGDFSVQLGSFSSMSAANIGWSEFQRRYPELAGAEKMITKARVNGKIYYRVAAKGFARASAQQLCGTVKGRGGGCIAHATSRPLPGAILGDVRMAAR